MRLLTRALLAVSILTLAGPLYAGINEFKTNNPDIDKYSFTKSYIAGLSYYHRVALRLKEEEATPISSDKDARAIQRFIENRTLDNTELRIARNYLTKPLDVINFLEVIDEFINE